MSDTAFILSRRWQTSAVRQEDRPNKVELATVRTTSKKTRHPTRSHLGSLQLLEENEAPLGQSVDDNFRTEKGVRDFDLKNFTYREGDIVALVCVEKYLIKNEWIQRSGYRASEETKI